MRTTRIYCLLLCAAVLTATDGNRIVLRVNDRIGTLYDYELRRDDRLRAIQNADMPPDQRAELLDRVGVEVLTDMLEELLVLSRADQIDYRPTAADINDAMVRARENFGIETEEQFEQALAQNGMTREMFRAQLETNMRVSGVLGREVQQRVDLSEEDLRRYYYEHEEEFTIAEQVRLSDIVVLDSSALSPEERSGLAEEIGQALRDGSPIAEVAAQHQEEGTTSGVVDLGWIAQGDLDPAIETAIWDLEAGSVSEPLEGRGGLHIVVVEERRPAELQPFSEVATTIEGIERQRLFSEEYGDFMQELRDSAYIRLGELPEDAQAFSIEESASRLVFEGRGEELSDLEETSTPSPEQDETDNSNPESD